MVFKAALYFHWIIAGVNFIGMENIEMLLLSDNCKKSTDCILWKHPFGFICNKWSPAFFQNGRIFKRGGYN